MNKFEPIIKKIQALEKYDQYEAALIFGSVAEGDFNKDSDLDVVIITKEDKKQNLLHPYINNTKLDLNYRSIEQLRSAMADQSKKKQRRPMIAGAKVLFDKTGELTKLVIDLKKMTPQKVDKQEENDIRFMVYHSMNKIERNIESDPVSAILTMHGSIDEILKAHYRINRRWFLSSKKLIKDLREWDKNCYTLLEKFLLENTPEIKYKYLQELVEYVLNALGGIRPLNEAIDPEFQNDIKLLIN